MRAFALVGVPMILVLIQPDLGTTLTYAPILIAGLFFGGISFRQAAILALCGTALVAGAWLVEFEELTGKNILVKSDATLHPEQFDIQG